MNKECFECDKLINIDQLFCSRECEDLYVSRELDKSETMTSFYDYMPLSPVDIDDDSE